MWREQILEALSDWPECDPTDMSFVLHLLSFPWTVLFAVLSPPPIMIGGWACFVSALVHIGVLTLSSLTSRSSSDAAQVSTTL
jgi:hypothetical protein